MFSAVFYRLSRKVVESAGIQSTDREPSNASESSTTVKTNGKNIPQQPKKDFAEDTYFYLSREIVDRFFADVQEYHNKNNHDNENGNESGEDEGSKSEEQSLKEKLRDAYQTIAYPFIGKLTLSVFDFKSILTFAFILSQSSKVSNVLKPTTAIEVLF